MRLIDNGQNSLSGLDCRGAFIDMVMNIQMVVGSQMVVGI